MTNLNSLLSALLLCAIFEGYFCVPQLISNIVSTRFPPPVEPDEPLNYPAPVYMMMPDPTTQKPELLTGFPSTFGTTEVATTEYIRSPVATSEPFGNRRPVVPTKKHKFFDWFRG